MLDGDARDGGHCRALVSGVWWRLGLLQVLDVPEQRAPVVEAVAATYVVAFAGDAIVVLMHVAVLLPLLQKEVVGLLRELVRDVGVAVVAEAEVDKIVHWTP